MDASEQPAKLGREARPAMSPDTSPEKSPDMSPETPPETSLASPCTGVCRLDPATGFCEGCRRTIDEIASWSSMDPAARRAVIDVLPLRGD
jgi:predicted Fe-S protein YdhL (DUF1289 family)